MITINGVTYEGNSVSISKNRVIIDGVDMTPDAKNITIHIDGNIETVKADACDSITVNGDAGKVKTMSGDVDITGNVTGDVETMSGDVKCGHVNGKVKTMSGDIRHKKM